jgi:disulfide bond formation protein DsbB
MMSRNLLMIVAAAGSLALLLGAFGFQYIGGLAPCQLCLWQRWPHAAAVVIGVLALWLGNRVWPLLGALAALASAGIGAFHVGVEQKWWEGLASCTVNALEGVSGADLLNTEIVVAAPVRCDAIAWQMMGVSMAGWNVIFSVALAVIWLMAARKPA